LDATVFSYNDLPAGQTDETLEHFSIEPDKAILIPLLKEIRAINPTIKIMGTPWSAPKWMKTNNNSIGGSLKPQYYPVYAQYLVKYLQAMLAEGIPLDAITVQNEPLHDGNNPSMYMTSNDMKTFVKSHLGPAFQNAGISTKIVVYDHNCDHPEYATNILSDADAAQYVDGSAFHLYAGDISALSLVHDAYPTKNLYFTEQWVGGPSNFGGDMQWHMVNLIIGASRNWAKCVLEWNLASDQNYQPHTNGGCTKCEGALTINNGVTRNVSYYIIGHASKFLPLNSVRINSNYYVELPNVAFKTPNGKKVLIVINTSSELKTFNIGYKGKMAPTSLPSGAVATYQWD
jgi:glucosylceramidase